MIIVLFGQPNSGKTTLANKLVKTFDLINIDGDLLRWIFNDHDYTRNGRINNLQRASDLAIKYAKMDFNADVVLSLVYPYQEARDYLNNLHPNIVWIYLTYDGIRGREEYHVKDFDIPKDVLTINTSDYSINECLNIISNEIGSKLSRRQKNHI